MKTAISIPDPLFKDADALARRLGVSRSALYATAVAELVAKHRQAKVSERLDALYAVERSTLDPDVSKAQRRAIRSTDW